MSFQRGKRSAGQNGFTAGREDQGGLLGRHSRDGWAFVRTHDSVNIEGKQYRDMREWRRPCSVCGADMVAFEKSTMVDANSRFSNRTCKEHRGLLPAFERGYLVWKDGSARPGYRCTPGATAEIDTDGKDTERVDALHLLLIGAGYKIDVDGIVDVVRGLLPPQERMPWNK